MQKFNNLDYRMKQVKEKLGDFSHNYILVPIAFIVAIIWIICSRKLRDDAIESFKKKGDDDD